MIGLILLWGLFGYASWEATRQLMPYRPSSAFLTTALLLHILLGPLGWIAYLFVKFTT